MVFMKKIYIPSNLDLSNIIDKEYQNDKDLDRLHYIINLIYEQRILYKNSQEYVPLKAIYMRNLVVRNYNDYVNILVRKGVIACDRHYIKNEKSFGYKLCEPYSLVRHKEISLLSTCVNRNVERWTARRLPTTKVHNHLYGFLQEIEIDYDKAIQFIDKLDVQEYNSAKIAIDKFKNRDFFLYCDEFGKRIHTNITNLRSTLRKYLVYKNQKLVNVDIANSQPLLLLISIPHLSYSIRCTISIYFDDVTPDVLNYKRLVEQGTLYDYLMKHAGETDRSVFKENFFRETFFGKRTSKLFCKLFPTIGEEIKKIKRKNYRRLAWLMQRTESKLMISGICRRIMEEHKDTFMATIHDSILTTQENVPIIKKIMSEEFEKLGLSPTIRIEST